jgi:hypothetical protein
MRASDGQVRIKLLPSLSMPAARNIHFSCAEDYLRLGPLLRCQRPASGDNVGALAEVVLSALARARNCRRVAASGG